ncbi:AAA family ATPase [Mesoplasma lactucae]|uniref:Chromosome partition protein Smc n=1 Tax=Mesoplasma lactucae ATCC 49193 TaxID=81460 RepID=A0A291IRV2_9MOLU|nr:AAA family ATPase [Mesoplasma lactucae]ATG97529.1 oxidoreductase [Mesoplasma lactucae ATCC 49193]ATZ20013.1 chromosome condensation and segregation SMC ATPase [Mesoplasma lactucae ATCC 49193]MCL8217036.1 Chromosome partition protein Smc [Mesoplasma lactucae ATCC 49193]
MLFLKSLYAHGFKSFAEPTRLDFTSEMIGVVGPNGSGKSNITDAIRWALGEQSNKSLRGKSMDDIVFSGSANKQPLTKAKVTLTFSNARNNFSTIDDDIVEITRTFDKKKRESEFFINGEKAKLKEIQDIALETGLTKSSLAIISQGTISNFAEAKPEARRELFNEAAGVAKYKKRKQEALTKLIKTQENLDRVNDIVHQIEIRIPKLKKQAEKALTYQEKSKELSKIETTVIHNDLIVYQQRLDEISADVTEFNRRIKELANAVNSSDSEFQAIAKNTADFEKEFQDLSTQAEQLRKRINQLRDNKAAAEKLEAEKDRNLDADNAKATKIKKEYQEQKIKLEAERAKSETSKQELNKAKEQYDYYDEKFEQTHDQIQTIKDQIMRAEIKLENIQKNSRNSRSAADAVVAQSTQIPGIIDKLINLIHVEPEYQVAISIAAGGGLLNAVVTKTNDAVKSAIKFLNNNPIGRVSFLPLNALSPNTISGVNRNIIEQCDGFVGFGNEIAETNSDYQVAVDYALGSVIICDNYDNASTMARKIDYRFPIVTLNGEKILPRGAVQAGKSQNQNLFSAIEKNDTSNVQNMIDELEQKEDNLTKDLNDYRIGREKQKGLVDSLNSQVATSISEERNLTKQMIELNDAYRLLTNQDLEGGTRGDNELESIKISREMNGLENKLETIQTRINEMNADRAKYASRQSELSQINGAKRKELDDLKEKNSALNYEDMELKSRIRQMEERLNEKYQLTIETVLSPDFEVIEINEENINDIRERIATLKQEIEALGNINLDAIQDYATEKENYDHYEKTRSEVQDAADKLQSVIAEMDEQMIKQFKGVVDQVNEALPNSFAKLFGGGTAELIYTDPDNMLETGIDIKVHPPGKKINNINLLSGGEKSLVALSVLFSILKVKPLPLVILDEAEAPLDPANVERFAKYIKDFTNDTQFIIVTHREGTMENCDVLYGVTMEQTGVTKIVKIKLVDAKKMAEED